MKRSELIGTAVSCADWPALSPKPTRAPKTIAALKHRTNCLRYMVKIFPRHWSWSHYKRNLLIFQRGPYDRNYVNLPTPSEASIPAHPVQWETDNYAVPVDQRREDNAIYSVPECPLYTTPVPKHARKKSKNNEPTYAILDTENTRTGPRNNFKDFGDSNYAEVRNLEACYAKVLPKNERTKQDNDPYSYVTNERTYANTKNVRPEAEYCEPGSNQRNQYANVMNDSRYANIPRQEYEEPAYCEPRYK